MLYPLAWMLVIYDASKSAANMQNNLLNSLRLFYELFHFFEKKLIKILAPDKPSGAKICDVLWC